MFISQNWPFNPAEWKNASKVIFLQLVQTQRCFRPNLNITDQKRNIITISIIEREVVPRESMDAVKCQTKLDNCFFTTLAQSRLQTSPLLWGSLAIWWSPELHNPPGCYMLLLKAKEIKLPQNRKPNKKRASKTRLCVCVCVQTAPICSNIPPKLRLLPAEQWHLNPPDRSSQVEPCWHRPSTQCFMGVWQRGPVCPCWHTHL